jgi:hypothetical protein
MFSWLLIFQRFGIIWYFFVLNAQLEVLHWKRLREEVHWNMLQIRLSKNPSSDGSAGVKHSPVETVTVACPDHLVLADLPVAKGIGTATGSSVVRNVGRRSRRQLGERVHFCVRCDYPIAIYGRLVITLLRCNLTLIILF